MTKGMRHKFVADLRSGEVTDTYGDTDIIYRNENGAGIQNIIATSKDDILIGSDESNVIEAGSGDDVIILELVKTKTWRPW